MGKKGGPKKGGSSKQKSQQSQPAGPASNVKSGTVGISQKHASKIRELVVVRSAWRMPVFVLLA